MNEPSLLDYLAARLRFWRNPPDGWPSFRQLWFEESDGEQAPPANNDSKKEPSWPTRPRLDRGPGPLPWAIASAVLMALAGRGMLDPTTPRWMAGSLAVAASIVAVAVAVHRGEVQLPSATDVQTNGPEPVRVRWKLAGAALLIGVVAGVAAAGNRFGPLTIGTWLTSVGLALAALVPPPPHGGTWWRWPVGWRPRNLLVFDRSMILPVICVGLALVVRTGDLAHLPQEMVSRHAEMLMSIVRAAEPGSPIVFPSSDGLLQPVPVYLGDWLAPLVGGLSFASLKLGTLLAGLVTLPLIFLLGRELAGRAAGLLGMGLAAVGQWPDVVSRIGFSEGWYPPFAAAALLFVVRGIRHGRRRDFVAAGIVIGLAMQTVSMAKSLLAMSVVLVVIACVQTARTRCRRLVARLAVGVTFAVLAGLPALAASYDLESGAGWWLGTARGTPDGRVFAGIGERLVRVLVMPLWSDGPLWVQGGVNRPALDAVAGAMLVIGTTVVVIGAVRRRRLEDMMLLASVPLLMLPAILAPVRPEVATSPMRCSGAMAPIFVLSGVGLAACASAVAGAIAKPAGRRLAAGLAIVVVAWSMVGSHAVLRHSFADSWDRNTWNSSELGEAVQGAVAVGVPPDRAWVVPYPYWVDTRLVAAEAGMAGSDLALEPDNVRAAVERGGPQLFLVHPADNRTIRTLAEALPGVKPVVHSSRVPGKEFLLFLNLSSTDES